MDTNEFEVAMQLIAAADQLREQQNQSLKEYRLYYDDADGTVIGLWERDHPMGSYVVLDDPDVFHRHNSNLMRVEKGKLVINNPRIQDQFRLQRSTQGQPVVRGHAIVALAPDEIYPDTEFYEPRNN